MVVCSLALIAVMGRGVWASREAEQDLLDQLKMVEKSRYRFIFPSTQKQKEDLVGNIGGESGALTQADGNDGGSNYKSNSAQTTAISNQFQAIYPIFREQVDSTAKGVANAKDEVKRLLKQVSRFENSVEEGVDNAEESEFNTEATFRGTMDSWKEDQSEEEKAAKDYAQDIMQIVGDVESGYQRDSFEREMESKIKKFTKTQIAALMPDGSTGREIGKAQDKLDDTIEEVMSEFDNVVDHIEGLMANEGESNNGPVTEVITAMKALQDSGEGSIQSKLLETQKEVDEIRGIAMSLGRDKTRFIKEAGDVGVALKDGITKILRMVEHQKETLNDRTNKWKAKADKATKRQFSVLRKAISLSKKGYRKLEKSIKKEHKTDLKIAKKAVSRVMRKASKWVKRKAKGMRKEFKAFQTTVQRLERKVEMNKERFEDMAKRTNQSVDKSLEKMVAWNESLNETKNEIEEGMREQARILKEQKEKEVKATIKEADDRLENVEGTMERKISEGEKKMMDAVERGDKENAATAESVEMRYEPVKGVVNNLRKEWKLAAPDMERGAFMESQKKRLVDRQGKQAKTVADSLVAKARSFHEQMLTKFKETAADDREAFIDKLNGMQKQASEKSASNVRGFSKWASEKTASMEGTLTAIEDAFSADNSGLVAKRSQTAINGMDQQVKVLKGRLHKTGTQWLQGTNAFKRALGAAITKASQMATSIGGEAEQEIGEQLGDAKVAMLEKLAARRKMSDAAVKVLDDLADSTEKTWMSDSVRQQRVINSLDDELRKAQKQAELFSAATAKKRGSLRTEAEKLREQTRNQKAEDVNLARSLVDTARHDLRSTVQGVIDEEKKKRNQAVSEAKQKWTRLTVQLPQKTKELDSTLGSIVSAQQDRVADVTRESKKLDTFAEAIANGGKNNAYQFLKGMDEITSATVDLWGEVEKGSDEEKALVKAQMEQMKQLMGDSMSQISEKTSKDMEYEMKSMNDKIALVMSNEDMTEEERKAAIKAIQDEGRQMVMQVMMKDAELAPLTEQYMSDANEARKQESLALSEDADIAAAMGTERGRERVDNAEAATAERKYALQVLAKGLAEEDRAAAGGQAELDAMAAQDAKDAAVIRQAAGTLASGVGAALSEAHSTTAAAADQGEKNMEFAKKILNRERSLIKETKSTVREDQRKLNIGIEREKRSESMGVLRVKEVRRQFVHDLDDLLDDADNLSSSVLKKRISRVDEMRKEFKFAFDALEATGNKDFADMMKKSLAFAKKVLQNMVNMKLQVYNEMQMNGDASETGNMLSQEYMSLRDKLLKQSALMAEQSTKLEAALRKKLAALGLQGHLSAEHLGAFLHQLTFGMANSEQGGFEHLLADLGKEFGFAIEAGDGVGQALGKSFDALSMKLGASNDLLRAVEKKTSGIAERFKASRERIVKNLSKESQFATMTDEELAERTRQLKALVARLSGVEKASSLVQGDPGSLLARAARLSDRVVEEQHRRAAARAEQEVLAREIDTHARA